MKENTVIRAQSDTVIIWTKLDDSENEETQTSVRKTCTFNFFQDVLEEKYNDIVVAKTDSFINSLEEKINSPDYNPSVYEQYFDQQRITDLQSYKTEDHSINEQAGGICPASKVNAENARQKCSFDFKYRKYLFQNGPNTYDSLEDCIENIVYFNRPQQVVQKTDLMVENNPILNKKQFVEFSFFPCSNEYE